MVSFFAVSAPGLETFTAEELRCLFPEPGSLPRSEADPLPARSSFSLPSSAGGVEFHGDPAALYRANLHLRTASRILARVGNFFHATTFPELLQRTSRLPWERYITPGQPICLRVTCHKSKLYHSDAVARTVSAALDERLGKPSPLVKSDEESEQPPQLVVVRLAGDRCTLSVDSSGVLLHKRGYRLAVAKAPLRETLAAAVLMASGWDKVSPLLDPFCGSGTIPIEAALMALDIPPGINRRFAFMDWPDFDRVLWETIRSQSSGSSPVGSIQGRLPPILASDRDAGAIKMSQANAERAGIPDGIEFKCQAVSSITPPPKRGWIVTNPPYGLRLGEGRDLRNLYAQFSNVLQRKCPGWNLAILCSDPILLGQMQVKFDTTLATVNGGIRVRLGRGQVGAGFTPAPGDSHPPG